MSPFWSEKFIRGEVLKYMNESEGGREKRMEDLDGLRVRVEKQGKNLGRGGCFLSRGSMTHGGQVSPIGFFWIWVRLLNQQIPLLLFLYEKDIVEYIVHLSGPHGSIRANYIWQFERKLGFWGFFSCMPPFLSLLYSMKRIYWML